MYSIRLRLEANEGGVFTATSPDVPGLVTEGSTPEEIQHNVHEALDGLIAVWSELGMQPPDAWQRAQSKPPKRVEILVK